MNTVVSFMYILKMYMILYMLQHQIHNLAEFQNWRLKINIQLKLRLEQIISA